MDIHVGDVLKMKKAHPCGSQEWLVPDLSQSGS